jgi:hypothetical protein
MYIGNFAWKFNNGKVIQALNYVLKHYAMKRYGGVEV